MLTALLGLWFLVAGREPPFPHPCEMGPAVTAATSTAGTDRSTAPDEHADHAAHHAASDAHQSEAPSHDTCECIGDCCCAPAIDRVSAPTRVEGIETVAFVLRPRGISRAPSTATRYLLPWANGPPGSLI